MSELDEAIKLRRRQLGSNASLLDEWLGRLGGNRLSIGGRSFDEWAGRRLRGEPISLDTYLSQPVPGTSGTPPDTSGTTTPPDFQGAMRTYMQSLTDVTNPLRAARIQLQKYGGYTPLGLEGPMGSFQARQLSNLGPAYMASALYNTRGGNVADLLSMQGFGGWLQNVIQGGRVPGAGFLQQLGNVMGQGQLPMSDPLGALQYFLSNPENTTRVVASLMAPTMSSPLAAIVQNWLLRQEERYAQLGQQEQQKSFLQYLLGM